MREVKLTILVDDLPFGWELRCYSGKAGVLGEKLGVGEPSRDAASVRCEGTMPDVATELRQKVRSLQEELSVVRETNVRLARELESCNASREVKHNLLARVRDTNSLLARDLETARLHVCPSPLGNPTREEAIEALRTIVSYANSAGAFPEARDLACLIDAIGAIARAALPKTGRES